MANILVVDDVPENRALLISVLGWQGHYVSEACNGREALEVLATHPMDLVITDLLMPEMDGFELTRQLASRPEPMRVLFYSASYNVREAMTLGTQCSVMGFIEKPAEPEAILAAVAKALEAPAAPPTIPPDTFEPDHIRLVSTRAAEAILEKRAATDRLLRLEAFGAELLAAKGPSDVARALCTTAREMVLASDAAVGLFPTDQAPRGRVVHSVLGGAVFEREGFSDDDALEAPSAVAGLAAVDLTARLGIDAGPTNDTLAIPIDTPARRHGWLCVASRIGGGGLTGKDGEILAAIVAQTAIACESAYRLERMTAHAKELTNEILKREQIATVLRHTQAKTKFALEAAKVGVWEIDIATGAARVDSAWAAVSQPTLETVPRTVDELFALVAAEDRERVEQAMGSSMSSGRDLALEFRVPGAAKVPRWIEIKAHVVRDSEGPGTMVGVIIDITERKILEEQLRESQKMEAIGQLAGGVAHDFNNILTAIVGYSDLLMSSLANEADRADAGEIRKAADRATALTRQLLAFSRRQMLKPAVVDLPQLVENLAPMLRRLIGEDVELTTHAADNLRRVTVDPGQFEQVLMNLVVNARDAMPKGGRIYVDLSNIDLDANYCATRTEIAPGPHVVMTITDTGVGIGAETLKHIFEPFFTTKPKEKGTGLGLSMVYGVVKQSGGHIAVYSEPGSGTAFKIYLPVASVGGASVPSHAPAVAARGGHETVLLTEDEPAVRAFATSVLRRFGYQVIEAADGAAALALIQDRHAPIDLLLTDVVMPGANGQELYGTLSQSMPALKVLFMSGYPGDAIVARGLDREAAFLEKPFTAEVLARRVRAVLDGRAA